MNRFQPTPAENTLLNDIEAADPGDGIVLWQLGQRGFLVKSSVGRVLFDPCLDAAEAGATQQVLLPGTLKSIDVVVLSQTNADCLIARQLKQVFDANPKAALLVPESTRQSVAERLGCDPTWPWGLNDGESVSFGELTILAMATGRNVVDFDPAARCNTLGYVVWFGDLKLYYGGATPLNPELVALLRPLAIDVALLPVDGGYPKNGAAIRIGNEAAQLAHDIGAKLLVLCSDDEHELNLESHALITETCKRLGQPFKMLNCGERILQNSATSNSRADRGD